MAYYDHFTSMFELNRLKLGVDSKAESGPIGFDTLARTGLLGDVHWNVRIKQTCYIIVPVQVGCVKVGGRTRVT